MNLEKLVDGWLAAVEYEQERQLEINEAVGDGRVAQKVGDEAIIESKCRRMMYERRARVTQELIGAAVAA